MSNTIREIKLKRLMSTIKDVVLVAIASILTFFMSIVAIILVTMLYTSIICAIFFPIIFTVWIIFG